MLANQQCYERGLEDLKLVCDAYIEDLEEIYLVNLLGSILKGTMCEMVQMEQKMSWVLAHQRNLENLLQRLIEMN